VDPVAHNLFFERFLNPDRMDPPDIDVDFAWDERDQIIDYVFSRYGTRRAAMVANHNTFAARSAVREVAKVLGLTDEEIGRVTKNIGFMWHLGKIWETLPEHPRMRGVDLAGPWHEILKTAVRLESHFNHLSTIAAAWWWCPMRSDDTVLWRFRQAGFRCFSGERFRGRRGPGKNRHPWQRSLAVIRDSLEMVEKNHGLRIEYSG